MLGTLSTLFGKIVARRNRKFDSGRGVVHVNVPVISVGNLSVGGTGKTPIVQMIVRMLQSMGHRPAVILRGYRRATRGHLLVHDGSTLLANAREAGDEAVLHATVLQVPVVVDEHKVDAAVFAAGMLPCDVIVVDDGFQHRALHRDIDVVVVDRATVDDQRLLPAGRLREPLTSLTRADVVLLTGGVNESEVTPWCRPDAVIGRIQIVAHCPDLSGQEVIAMCGIANPERFHNTVKGCGANIAAVKTFRDHHVYTKSDIMDVIALAKQHRAIVVTTEKDAVKLDKARELFTQANVTLTTLPIEAILISSSDLLNNLLTDLLNNLLTDPLEDTP